MYCDFANTDLRERIRSIAVPVLVLLEPHFKNIASIVNEQYRNLQDVYKRQQEYASRGSRPDGLCAENQLRCRWYGEPGLGKHADALSLIHI